MAGNKIGARTRRETMIDRFGSEEAYLEFMRNLGGKGGKVKVKKGFAVSGKAREAGRIGGTVSRRGPSEK